MEPIDVRQSYTMPTVVCEPRCFVLDPITNREQALTQAGEYGAQLFKELADYIPFRTKRNARVEAKLLHRRLVPFWHVASKAHYDYTQQTGYTITAKNPDASSITITGPRGYLIEYQVDRSGRSGGKVNLSGIERCIRDLEYVEWADSYVLRNEEALQPPKGEKQLRKYTLQNPRQIFDLDEFVNHLAVDGNPLFNDGVETIIVNPLESADAIVKRATGKVSTTIQFQTLHTSSLEIIHLDLYFRPLFVFQFERLDENGTLLERRQEELDALDRKQWTNLARIDYERNTVQWDKVFKLTLDIGAVVFKDVPGLGAALEISSIVTEQAPGLLNNSNS